MLDSEVGVERAVRIRAFAAWRKWREIAGLLLNKSILLRNRGRIYDACIRLVCLYRSEGWPMTDIMRTVLTQQMWSGVGGNCVEEEKIAMVWPC